jgi:hypothetical protein
MPIAKPSAPAAKPINLYIRYFSPFEVAIPYALISRVKGVTSPT